MLFVIFILGALFASSVGFLALMGTDAEIIQAARREHHRAMVLDDVLERILGQAERSVRQDVFGAAVAPPGPVPYVALPVDVQGAATTGFPANTDSLPRYASIPGVDPWLSSHDPDDPGTGVLEYFAVTDLLRAWDGRADVRFTPTGLEPRMVADHPLRIRPLNALVTADPLFDCPFDCPDDTVTRQGGLADADADGIWDSRWTRLSLLGGGELDFFPADADGPDGLAWPDDVDDTDCNGTIDVDPTEFKGPPAFTGGPQRTPLPCDDENGSGNLEFGTDYPAAVRRVVAEDLREPELSPGDAGFDEFDDVYVAVRQLQHGGMVNLNQGHRTLLDNLLGLDGGGQAVSLLMGRRPYGVETERLLRHRGYLLPFRSRNPPDPLGRYGPLGQDMQDSGGRRGPLYQAIYGPLGENTDGVEQWTPIVDQPGVNPDGHGVYDVDVFWRWTNPNSPDYAIHPHLTTVSTDDLLLRNGTFDAAAVSSGAVGGGGSGGGTVPVLLTRMLPAYDPALDTPYTMHPSNPDSALEDYPAADLNYLVNGVGDRSFIDPLTGAPKVPLRLTVDGSGHYGRPRDAAGQPMSDVRYGGMQFSLWSVGDINYPTRREIETVQQYFMVMLRNVTNSAALVGGAANLGDAIDDQAAQLAANFFDFADYDSGNPGGNTLLAPPTVADVPTRVVSATGTGFYGIEKQPYLSELYWRAGNLAVELTNPHEVPIDLSPYGRLRVGPNPGDVVEHHTPYALAYVQSDGTRWPRMPFTESADNVIPVQDLGGNSGYVFVTNDPNLSSLDNISPDALMNVPATPAEGDKIQLLRLMPPGGGYNDEWVICDEIEIPPGSNFGQDCPAESTLQRDNAPTIAGSTLPRAGGAWRVTVPEYQAPVPPQTQPDYCLTHTLGEANDAVRRNDVAPVHAMTSDLGLEASYPNTASLLLLMRYANMRTIGATPVAATRRLQPRYAWVDNGHMPIFDDQARAQVMVDAAGVPTGAQPLDGTTLLDLPWGQLVFDYFTALPFANVYDPTQPPPAVVPAVPPGDPNHAAFVNYLRANKPTVELGGLRVHGRININAAPWRVLEGLPLVPPSVLPIYRQYDQSLARYLGAVGSGAPLDAWRQLRLDCPGGNFVDQMMGEVAVTRDAAMVPLEQLGRNKALGWAAYRELRAFSDNPTGVPTWTTGSYNVLAGGIRLRQHFWDINGSGLLEVGEDFLGGTSQRHTAGFLGVGELANVRNPFASGSGDGICASPPLEGGPYQMDNGQQFAVFADLSVLPLNFLYAAAPLISLDDWATVKGHTFTACGVFSGHGEIESALGRADRFVLTYDRSNVLNSPDPYERPDVILKMHEPLSQLSND